MKPTLTILVGVPASGKSTWARDQSALVVSRDELREAIKFHNGGKWSHQVENEVRDVFRAKIRVQLSLGNDVIADATNLLVEDRAVLRGYAREYGAAVRLVLFKGLERAVKRNKARYGTTTFVPAPAMVKLLHRYAEAELALLNESYDEIEEVR